MRACCLALLYLLMFQGSSLQGVSSTGSPKDSCTIVLPVNVIVPDGRLIRDLPDAEFVAEGKREPAKIVEVIRDRGPRRILLLVETGRNVPKRVRVAESGIVADMLSEARPDDSFALLTARGKIKEVRFGESPDTISTSLKELETATGTEQKGNGVLDALDAAVGWFAQPRVGDSIVLMSTGLQTEHQAGFKQVRQEMTARQIRVFSLLFAPRIYGTIVAPTVRFSSTGPQVIFDQTYFPNSEDEASLSWATGGYSVQVDIVGDSQREERLTDQKLEDLKTAASRMQSAITEFYRLTVSAPTGRLALGLSSDIKEKVPQALILYPRQLPPCQSP